MSDKEKTVLLREGRAPLSMTPVESIQKVVKPGPGDAQKGRQPVSMTPVPSTPASASDKPTQTTQGQTPAKE